MLHAMSWRFTIGCVVLALMVNAACRQDQPKPETRERLRVVIPATYQAQIKTLMSSDERSFSLSYDDIDWVSMPFYKGRDAVFAASLASRLEDSDPDADVFFIDLYRLRSFRPSWLTPMAAVDDSDENNPFRPAFQQAARLTTDHIYAVPWSAKGNFLFYRSDLIKTPPKTWDELKKQCNEVASKRLDRRMRFCLLVSWDSLHNDLYPLLWSLSDDGALNLASEEVTFFMTELVEAFGLSISGGFRLAPPVSNLQDEVGRHIHRRFAGGEAVFMINWNNRLRYMANEAKKNGSKALPMRLAPIPAASEDGIRWSNIGTWGWIVPSPSKTASATSKRRHEMARTFVQELTSRASVEHLSKSSGLISARNDVALPQELEGLLDDSIVKALDSETDPNLSFAFGDRGSDTFVHRYVLDALQDILQCRTRPTHPNTSVLMGDCARYYDECLRSHVGLAKPTGEASATESSDVRGRQCLRAAVRRRLHRAQSQIDALGFEVEL